MAGWYTAKEVLEHLSDDLEALKGPDYQQKLQVSKDRSHRHQTHSLHYHKCQASLNPLFLAYA